MVKFQLRKVFKDQTYTYVGELPLVQSTSIAGLKTFYSYSYIENDIAKMQIEGSPDQYSFEYTTDGVLTKLLRNN